MTPRIKYACAFALGVVALISCGVAVEFGAGWGLIVAGCLVLGPALAVVYGVAKTGSARDLDEIESRLETARQVLADSLLRDEVRGWLGALSNSHGGWTGHGLTQAFDHRFLQVDRPIEAEAGANPAKGASE